jgi:hypothetical protein
MPSKSRKSVSTLKRKYLKNRSKTMNNRSKQTGKALPKQYSNSTKSNIVRTFLDMLDTVKLYHWRTHSYAQHKATDELHHEMGEHVDKFVEILMGKTGYHITMVDNKCRKFNEAKTTMDIKSKMYAYRRFLSNDMSRIFSAKQDTDLLNIRDEILGDINQFLYLLTLE